jgi:phosphoglycerate dehydrogenase-like enzyme
MPTRIRPRLVISAPDELFASFFTAELRFRLSRNFRWCRVASRSMNPALKNALRSCQALITTWDSPCFSNELVELAPSLRIVAHCGGEVKKRFARPLFTSLTITNAAEPMVDATAEMGAAFLLYCARNIDYYRAELRKRSNHIYAQSHSVGGLDEALVGREVAMIGFGRVGRRLTDLLRPFGIRWRVFDPYAPREFEDRYPVRFSTLRSVLKRARFLMITAALTDETRGLLNAGRLAALAKGAFVINIGRGGIVDLPALTREVQRGRLFCALDVTDPEEPLPLSHPLRRISGALLTPHVAGSPQYVRHGIAETVVSDLEKFFRGESVANRVAVEALEHMS